MYAQNSETERGQPVGTNYYHRTNLCSTCGRYDSRHIGKSSAGWTFSFRGHEDARSWQEWRAILTAGGAIFDEYGTPVTPENFERMVTEKQSAPNNHTRYMEAHYSPEAAAYDRLDEEGHAFSHRDFC